MDNHDSDSREEPDTDRYDADDRHRSGGWLGSFAGMEIREPGEDADGAVVEIHGDEGMVAVEIDDPEVPDKLSEAAAEIGLILSEQ
jgi:ribosomal protein L35AE/L33A